MPAEKSARSSERKRIRNRLTRGSARKHVRAAELLIEQGEVEQAKESTRQAISAVDKAKQKGVIHANRAARVKSRLLKKLNLSKSKD